MNWTLLQNSLWVSGGAALLATGLGFIAALWLNALDARWRRPLFMLALVALVLPPFLVTNCWLHLLGLNGVWRRWWPGNIYSLGGATWILALLTWPLALLFISSAWRRLEPAMLESDPALTGGALVRWLLWPLARGAAGLAALVAFVLALNNFAVPAILQVKVLPAELWVSFNTHLDPGRALAASWPLIAIPAALVILLRRSSTAVSWSFEQGAATAAALRRQLGARWFWMSGFLTVAVLGLSVGLPLVELVAEPHTWTELPTVWRALPAEVWQTFWLAATTASLCVALGLAAWKWPLGGWIWWPFLVPGVFLGIGLIFFCNRPGLMPLYRSAGIVLLAWTLRYAALAWYGLAQAFRGTDRHLADAVRLESASRWAQLRYAQWPQIAPQAGAVWCLTYLLCLWDVETLVLIYPPGGETLALRIFNLLHYGHTAQVNALCLLLLGLALAPWLLLRMVMAVRKVNE